ncbi:MAG: ATP-dependent DNA helicase RecG [Chloroflexota bacterium]
MPLNTEALRRVLDLEEKKDYADKAVIGGMDGFLRNWGITARASITSPGHLSRFYELRLDNPAYVSLNRDERQKWAKDVLTFLSLVERGEEAPAVKIPKKKRPSSAKPKAPGEKTDKGSLDQSITVIKGISETTASRFKRLGVRTIRDLLYFFPNRHLDYSHIKTINQLADGKEETIIAHVWQAKETNIGSRRSTEAIVGDETGNIRVIWFNNPYIARRLATNTGVIISGRVGSFHGRHVFESPEWELLEDKEPIHTGRLVPVYPLTSGLYARQVRKLMKGTVAEWAGAVPDFIPPAIREQCDLLPLTRAISQAHFPDDETSKDRARVRLAFDELFLLQLGMVSRKHRFQKNQSYPFVIKRNVLHSFIKSLPFKLTASQERVLEEIFADLQKPVPMSRLLQGEVGSGKTVVATAALLIAIANGYQAAFMAPTEILAEQHFRTISHLFSQLGTVAEDNDSYIKSYTGFLTHPLTVTLLTGNISPVKKKEIQERIAGGAINIIIGTHALIQKGVTFNKLGLVVIDEQHRFGVAQRSTLRQKGYLPHVMVMTATPIPRTLALTIYGDLDLSVINELPAGRREIKTRWLKPEQRNSAYAFLKREVVNGHQAFIICPLVEESETVVARAAVAEYERLSHEVFPDLKMGLLHGRMAATDKDEVMRRFHSRELDILVSTPVVEVGIDVPNATVMLIESANRFGLSQLNLFRGRVGRGEAQSYCMLLSENPSEIGQKRLDIIEKTRDGFVLAEEDLKLRGPGEFFGTRQSGLPDLRMAKLSDVALLEMARREAVSLFELDPMLNKAEHELLSQELNRIWQGASGLI